MTVMNGDNVVGEFIYNGKRYYRVFVNGTNASAKVDNVPMGMVTITVKWGYESRDTGSGCDRDLYYYPKNPIVTVTCSAPDLKGYKLELLYDVDGTDCFTPSYSNYTLTDSIITDKVYSVTIPGTKTWSNGDSAERYAYENVYIKVYLIDPNSDGFGVSNIGSINMRCYDEDISYTIGRTAYMQGQ